MQHDDKSTSTNGPEPRLIAHKVPDDWMPDHPLRWGVVDSQDPDDWASRGCSEAHAKALVACGAACVEACRPLARQGLDDRSVLPDMIAGSLYRLMLEHAPTGVDASIWSLDHGWLVKWVIRAMETAGNEDKSAGDIGY